MIGIVTAAYADADGMKTLMIVWIPYIVPNAPTLPDPSRADAIEPSNVSMTFPSLRITMIPAANPIIRAAEKMSFAPAMNS